MRQSDSEMARDARSTQRVLSPQREPSAGWERLQRAALTLVGLLGTVGLLALAGCPADLANPQDYERASVAGGGSGVMQPGLAVDTSCLTTVFSKSCANIVGCHKASSPAAGLDLETAGVNKRLIDVVTTHADALPATGCMSGQKLIDSANPQASWLLLKLTTPSDAQMCGIPMPVGPALGDTDMACVNKYLQDVHAAALAGM